MRYRNPILYGDYSDPDVIRVGEDFYMISSSFTYLPGIPVLHSRDLVHWELIGYAAERLPFPAYDVPAHKKGTWAPSIRYREGKFYVYVCLPDEGLICLTAEDPAGRWDFHYVKDVSGWIDPCPLFSEDGSVWLIHGLAASRCGINNMLFIHRMSEDGLNVLDKGTLVYNGADHGDVTVEGPKIYERQGKYWILCPAGGVAPGYQLALRSENILGPYERKIVLAQGSTPVNGPHQGGWIEDGRGRDWFIHFQDVGVYGRVPHLQPVDWSSGWPVMGNAGEPVPEGDTGLPLADAEIPESDDFREGPGLQWQWQANPNPLWWKAENGELKLRCVPAPNLFQAGQFLSQLMQHRNFDMDVRLQLETESGDEAGLAMMGYGYSMISADGSRIRVRTGEAAETNRWIPDQVTETEKACAEWKESAVLLRMRVQEGTVSYFYGRDETDLRRLGETYPLTCGGWTSARPGMFALNRAGRWGGWARVSACRIRPDHGQD
ncbi:MAG: glycoside hydrolase 43 family protein [Clostridiales bacterium]|nr:glycoside hydrolase 43 family protein [Clostridiales bacterium]